QLQLLGGIWIIQTLPAVLIGAYTRWLNPWAQLAGWAVGIATGTWMAAAMNFNGTFPLQLAGWTFPGYSALYSLALNLIVAVVLTPLFNRVSKTAADQTEPADYHAAS
ncbi:MAG: sodium:solute symporter, partial [Verrucomicrobia bacterium]|nr:sodium:solute symporter [Verrucomicrobiota bacterium]